jgi:cyclophilin family peptidyl-prolyl cis-trans isomerase
MFLYRTQKVQALWKAGRRFFSSSTSSKQTTLPLIRFAPVVAAVGFASASAAIYVAIRARGDRNAIESMEIVDGNPIAFLEIADGEVPLGRLLFQLRADAAPMAAENFSKLCTHAPGYGYRSTAIFGIEKGRRLFGGDFYGSGAGSFSAFGETFPDEEGGLALRHLGPGTLAMRNSGPNSNGSQFYISLRRLPDLDGRSVIVGYAADAATLDLIEQVGRTFAGNEGRIKKGHDLRVSRCGLLDQQERAKLRPKA